MHPCTFYLLNCYFGWYTCLYIHLFLFLPKPSAHRPNFRTFHAQNWPYFSCHILSICRYSYHLASDKILTYLQRELYATQCYSNCNVHSWSFSLPYDALQLKEHKLQVDMHTNHTDDTILYSLCSPVAQESLFYRWVAFLVLIWQAVMDKDHWPELYIEQPSSDILQTSSVV